MFFKVPLMPSEIFMFSKYMKDIYAIHESTAIITTHFMAQSHSLEFMLFHNLTHIVVSMLVVVKIDHI